MTPSAKQPVSTAVFSIGAACGLIGCGMATLSLFTVGQNDSALALWLGWPCLMLFSPVCLLALWHRRFAGICFLLAAVSWTASVFIQHRFRVAAGLPTNSFGEEFGNLIYTVIFASFAAFAFIVREVDGRIVAKKW
jgi:hypothetical protein